MKNSRYWRPVLETLDVRILPAINFDSGAGVLTVDGEGKDVINIELVGTDLQVTQNNGTPQLFAAASVTQIVINAGNGKDEVTIGATVAVDAVVDGGNGTDDITTGAGNDSVTGGNGKDAISTGAGLDFLDGGNGVDDLNGGDDNDVLLGGNGKDLLDGGAGINLLDGGGHKKETLLNGIAVEMGVAASLALNSAAAGAGTASLGIVTEADGTEGEFNVALTGVTGSAGQSVDVFVDGVNVGSILLDANGDGALNHSLDPDGGETAFPGGFPSVVEDSVIEIRSGAVVLLNGTFG